MNSKKRNNIRILVVHNSLSPYRIPFFRKLASISGVEFYFLFSKAKESKRLWKFEKDLGFNYKVIECPVIKIKTKKLYLWANVNGFSEKYDLIVLNDHLNIPEIIIQIYAKWKHIPVLRWIATTENQLSLEPLLKRKIKGLLNQKSDAILVPGSEAKEYAMNSTKGKVPVYICNNVVDNDFFKQGRFIPEDVLIKERKRLGLTGGVVAYFGQLISRKGVDVLLKAIESIPPHINMTLLLVGEGKLIEEAEKIISRLPNVNLSKTGYVVPEQLPLYYALSDIVVLPSNIDTWGMVVNEAMAAGKPIICSTGAGASRDIISDGVNGFIFEKGNYYQLSKQIERLMLDKILYRRFITKADERLEYYTIDYASEQFLKAVNNLVYHGRNVIDNKNR